MNSNRVCAIVVTFWPEKCHLDHLAAVRSQVQSLIVVDNASPTETVAKIRGLSKAMHFEMIENRENLGIAAALNMGIRRALSQGCEWLLLLDQDSKITDGFVMHLLDDIQLCRAEDETVMQIVPQYRDPLTNEVSVRPGYWDGPFITITSGSFFHASAFFRCGYFTEELFIYCVDDDFSIRLRRAGYRIVESSKAILLHRGGSPSRIFIFGKEHFTPNYLPAIHYYWARNRVWLIRKHGLFYPPLILTSLRSFFSLPLKIWLGEKNRLKKMRMFGKGLVDGIRGITGKQVMLPRS